MEENETETESASTHVPSSVHSLSPPLLLNFQNKTRHNDLYPYRHNSSPPHFIKDNNIDAPPFLSAPSFSIFEDEIQTENERLISLSPTESPHMPLIERPNTPNYTQMTTHLSQLEPDTTALWGWMLLLATFVMFISSMYAIVFSKFVPETGNRTLDWIKRDEYYCLLLPITLSVTVYAVFWNWMGFVIPVFKEPG
ncbi:13022_t:CDS:2 [Ambispora leptoticha]|uniref:13022_t:CDS:1 n=1 Tax=Ambispora leptoticha TaxID=144679 RepID=A0A9N9FHG6_9GLOM|nr:13022_t:CDS:2 [Ambispora leptoticha]